MSARLFGVLVASLWAVGCGNDCGSYQYKGVIGTEWCGDVYGTEGTLVEGEPELAWAELRFRHDVPASEFYFEHSGSVSVKFMWSDIESGDAFDDSRALGTCAWTDRGDPRTDNDDVQRLEPPTSIRLEGHGGGLNFEPDVATVREVSWEVVCDEGVFRLEGRDKVKFDHVCCAEVVDGELAAWLAQE